MVSLASIATVTFTSEQLRLHNRRIVAIRVGATALSVVLLLVVWELVASYNRPWVPSIPDTVVAMRNALTSATFYADLAITAERQLSAFVTSTLTGFLIGAAMGLHRPFAAFATPLVAIALAVPDPVYVIFASLALNTGELAGFVALVLAVLPFVINVVVAGFGARDRGLDEMARIYHVPMRRGIHHVIVPQIVPSLLTATRFSFALSWKVVILVEALTRPDGIGARIYENFHVIRMRDAVAEAVIFCVLMQLVEWLVFVPTERRLLRWRS